MRSFILLVLLAVAVLSCSPKNSDSALPETWTKDFTITLYSGGGMQDAETNLTFTYDSCSSKVRTVGDQKNDSFVLTETMRTDILAKMKELEADKIRTVLEGITHDKETDRICFNTAGKESCVSQSATQQIHEADRSRFADAWSYLSDFAYSTINN